MTLTEFLLARITEDEAWAGEALALSSIYAQDSLSWHWIAGHDDGSRWMTTSHDPARVLAECEAKRRIIAMDFEHYGEQQEVLLYLALPYVDHSDFRPEWKP
jgi:hypothetical protein